MNYRSYNFILYKSSFENQDALLKVLHFLSGRSYIFFGSFPKWEYAVLPLEFEENKTEYRIKISNDVCLRVLQDINNYVESIYNDVELQDHLMSAVNTSDVENDIDKPSFFQIFPAIIDDRRVYPAIQDNQSCYSLGDEGCSSGNNEMIPDVDVTEEERVLYLIYKNQTLYLNDRLICNCNVGSGNDNLLRFLISNPNKTWTRTQLISQNILITNTEQNSGKYTKSFYTFLTDIKVAGKDGYPKIGELFFTDKSTNSIHLINPVYKTRLQECGVEYDTTEDLLNQILQRNNKI